MLGRELALTLVTALRGVDMKEQSGGSVPAGTPAPGVEVVSSGGVELCRIVKASFEPPGTVFVTSPEREQQVGFVKYAAGSEIARHYHLPVARHIHSTSEVVLVRSGRCDLDVYDDGQVLVATIEVGPGDLVIIEAGGHGFRVREDTVLLEVKQGPYAGLQERERF